MEMAAIEVICVDQVTTSLIAVREMLAFGALKQVQEWEHSERVRWAPQELRQRAQAVLVVQAWLRVRPWVSLSQYSDLSALFPFRLSLPPS